MNTTTLPLLPLRDIVMFPLMTLPLLIGRARSLRAFEAASTGDGRIVLLAQRDPSVEQPHPGDLYRIGTVARAIRHLVMPNGQTKLLMRGLRRAAVLEIADDAGFQTAEIRPLDKDEADSDPSANFDLEGWSFAGTPEPRVAALQRLLEDDALAPGERLRLAVALMRGSQA